MTILTLEEAARMLRCTPQTLYAKVSKKEIPFFRLGKGGHIRFEQNSLMDWMKKQMEA